MLNGCELIVSIRQQGWLGVLVEHNPPGWWNRGGSTNRGSLGGDIPREGCLIKGGAHTTTHGAILLAVRFSKAWRLGDECNVGVGIRRSLAQKRQLCHGRRHCSILPTMKCANQMNALDKVLDLPVGAAQYFGIVGASQKIVRLLSGEGL